MSERFRQPILSRVMYAPDTNVMNRSEKDFAKFRKDQI